MFNRVHYTYRMAMAIVASIGILFAYQNCGDVNYDRIPINNKIGPINCIDEQQFMIQGTEYGEINLEYPFALTSSVQDCINNVSSVEWDMGDGSSLSGLSVKHTYIQENTFTITARVTTTEGNFQDVQHSIQIVDPNGCNNFNNVQIIGNTRGYINKPEGFSFTALQCLNVNSINWSNNENADISGLEFYNTLFTTVGTKTITLEIHAVQGDILRTHDIDIVEECGPYEVVPEGEYTCVDCPNGAINPTSCDECLETQTLVNGQCIDKCTNGATNPPDCDNNTCNNGATNYPDCNQCPSGKTLVNRQCVNSCTNGATNPPDCDNNTCNNGATSYPDCNQCSSGQVLVNNQCVNQCTNGATNPPDCDNNTCNNGATNYPDCNQCPSGKTLVNGLCVSSCTNGATNPPNCSNCPSGKELIDGDCVNKCALDEIRNNIGQCVKTSGSYCSTEGSGDGYIVNWRCGNEPSGSGWVVQPPIHGVICWHKNTGNVCACGPGRFLNGSSCANVGKEYYSPGRDKASATESQKRTSCNWPTRYTTGTGTGADEYADCKCGIDLQDHVGTCAPVGDGAYSPYRNNSRYLCTNKPLYSYYVGSGNGSNNCPWECKSGYQKSKDGSSCEIIKK